MPPINIISISLFFIYFIKDIPAVKNFFNSKLVYPTRINKLTFDRYNQLLGAKFTYYQTLTPQGQAKFLSRLISIKRSKDFEGRGGVRLNEEQIVLICASMVQLSYGLKGYRFDNIDKILVFPEQFYSPMFQQDVKGLTSHEGFVAISWKDFEQGYLVADDCYNLGLHEMAHALKLDAIIDGGFDGDFVVELRRFQQVGIGEYASIREGYTSILRDYAGSNMQEFFAVCVENFFEAPERFKESLPEVFQQLCILLNQNPLNLKNDYYLSPKLKEERDLLIFTERAAKPEVDNNAVIIFGVFLFFFAAILAAAASSSMPFVVLVLIIMSYLIGKVRSGT